MAFSPFQFSGITESRLRNPKSSPHYQCPPICNRGSLRTLCTCYCSHSVLRTNAAPENWESLSRPLVPSGTHDQFPCYIQAPHNILFRASDTKHPKHFLPLLLALRWNYRVIMRVTPRRRRGGHAACASGCVPRYNQTFDQEQSWCSYPTECWCYFTCYYATLGV
jgi:hypothetical protein